MTDNEAIPEGHSCGYCKNQDSGAKSNTSITHGLWAHQLTSSAYTKLMDRGWRRCGTYLYKPYMDKTCCPLYTIRQKCGDFKISKSQRKCLIKFSKHLNIKQKTDKLSWLDIIELQLKNPRFEVKTIKVETDTLKIESDYQKSKYDSLKVYQNYQVAIHKDKISDVDLKQWERFLCNPPRGFGNENVSEPTSATLEGAYHQQYILDGKIIAVGVCDFLDNCLSSVYLYYDPDYHFLTLGTYTALLELYYCIQNKRSYYYMGYYVHNCEKMVYKSRFKPNELLLCPVSLNFINFNDRVENLLNENKFSRLDLNIDIPDFRTIRNSEDANNALILNKNKIWNLKMLASLSKHKTEMMKELKTYQEIYFNLIGKDLAENDVLMYLGS